MQTVFMLASPSIRTKCCSLSTLGLVSSLLCTWLAPLYPIANAQTIEQSATYVSQVDEDLTIRRVSVLPVVDNVDGIYARPIEAQLKELLKSSHRWDYIEASMAGAVPTATELEENPEEVQRVTRSVEADAFVVAAASRGPNGLSLRVDLFLKNDGKLLAQEVLRDHPRFDIAEVRVQIKNLYEKLVAKLPYDGIILSRQQNRVTVNLGRSDGLKKDQIITAIQIISANRHPRFNFLISTDKEILGSIKILKVDETLSFGAIVSEKEKGAIRRFAKISGLDPVNYPAPDSLDANSGAAGLSDREDSAVTFGKDPKEWLPVRPPSFGQVGLKVGLGSYNSNMNLNTEALEAKSSFYPSLGLHGEIWLNPNWTVRAELLQGVLSTSNPGSGSTPDTLNHSMSRYSLEIDYNFLIRDDFFGPKLQVGVGFASYKMFVDDSQPRSLTTATYSGLLIGLGGAFPVTEEKIWFVGGRLNLFVQPNMQESPVTSGGSPSSSINDFSLFVERKIAENIKATAALDFSLYSTNFNGSGSRTDAVATSLSHRHTILNGGVVYQF